MLKRRRDAVVEDFVKGEFLRFLKLADYAEVVIDSWKGTYGTCLCGDDDRQPAVPDFLEPNVRPDTPPAADAGAGEPLETGGEYAGEFGEEEGEYLLASAPGLEFSREEIAEEEELEEEASEDLSEQGCARFSEAEPCKCIHDFMMPFPPDEYDFPFNTDKN
ncbi:Hypothetical protein NTJ_08372 [Nesidiocoris tenuis]|nr:Hypothetical protein NTJ_08372 [Nesidiocoris tenuis]